jgi:NADH-quinone oxidoreductase subunit L
VIALIPLVPFLGFLVNATLGRRLPKTVSGGVASAAMVVAFLLSASVVWSLAALPVEERVLQQTVFTWIASGDFVLDLSFLVDPLSAVMLLVITGIGSLIHIYSTAYMHEEADGEFARYFSYLNLFASFMLVLVLGSSFLVMFVGWEGVGLCSYLLIGFWFSKKSASDAGKKAFVVNRVGDYAFILGMLLLFTQFGTLEFAGVAAGAAALPVETSFGLLSLATLLLFVGATGKSAQIPLYVWLPDAMEGPTPVSALIHAATMVTAGVYMIGRNAVLFSQTPETLFIVAVIGALTALLAGTIGLVQNDIKRVLAYSTVSQLGYMFLAMGVGAFGAGIFHLYTHAFFKALLFLGSGAVIHALHGEQDIRHMGGLKKALPITYWTFLVGSLAIAGVPGLAGFFSKDEILFEAFLHGHTVLWAIGAVTAALTATYMFRLVFLTFHGEYRGGGHTAGGHGHDHGHDHGKAVGTPHLHDAPPAMALALIVLALGSVLAGYVGVPEGLGGGNRLGAWLEPVFEAPVAEVADETLAGALVAEGALAEAEAGEGEVLESGLTHEEEIELEHTLTAVSSVIALGGIGLAFFVWMRRREIAAGMSERLGGLHRLLLNKYYVDEAYDAAVVRPVEGASREALWKVVDAKVIDGAVNGAAAVVEAGARGLRLVQTGSVRAYAGSLFLGAVLILGYYLWS